MTDIPFPEYAWIVGEWIKGRTYGQIARQLGRYPYEISDDIQYFCEHFTGYRFNSYDPGYRREIALAALGRFLTARTFPKNSPVQPEILDPDEALLFPYTMVGRARYEHAFLLRCEGLTLKQIGARLGVSKERARQMILKFARTLSYATRRTRARVYPPARLAYELHCRARLTSFFQHCPRP